MSVLEYIEETNPAEVRELLLAAHLYLQESLPPFATCAIKWRIPFYSLRRNFCYLNRHRDHITLGFPHGYKLAPQPGVLLGESEHYRADRRRALLRFFAFLADFFFADLPTDFFALARFLVAARLATVP